MIEDVFRSLLSEQPDGLVVIQRAVVSGRFADQIAGLAAAARLPAIAPWRRFAEAGGLLAYEARTSDAYREVARYVDRILRGESPARMPVETPRSFDLIVNRRTARAFALELPASFLAQADFIID
jgi:putative ABC transport system substrate-binding protein